MIRDMDALEHRMDVVRGPKDPPNQPEILPSVEELLHVARLVTIGELAACFAHEVMNPLTTIRGNLSIANYELPGDHPARLYLEAISRAERRIEALARRMLNFSKKRDFTPESHDVAEIIADAIKFVEPYFAEADAQLQARVPSGLPHIEADRCQLVQALVNLLQNACEAMAGTPQRTLTISAAHESDDIRISVADTGRGISEENLPRIFTPFFTTKGEAGTGLGLYITRRIIEDHRGTITVESGAGGTTFTISLSLRD
jgi:signal transduction histidine kinase